MTISLEGIPLPKDLEWQDEFDWNPVRQATDRSLTGKLMIDEAIKVGGRPMTLFGGANACWVPRSTITALFALTETPGLEMTLSYHGTDHTVIWNRENGPPIDANQVTRIMNPGPNHKYYFTLRLMEVA
ncbi:hypothetical protein [Marinobacterium lutimaris]|uniref:Uncharacterized protein n=1 Tax=Marinobacterium lutimaris TaxID=568106 RepID=A0A1H5XKG9_9GAMM|nr:hypothetical protein [Marinobacterium lutimaris]SEG12133.1 hypothetical protein SAMN05444390_1011415 [Marinobacterium lutimaris]